MFTDLRCLFGRHKCFPFSVSYRHVYRNSLCGSLVCILLKSLFKLFFITAPANPPIVSGQSHDSTSVSVEWTFDKSTRNVLGVLQGFHIYYVRQDGRGFPLVTTGADESSLRLIDLKPYTEYNVTVGAFTMAGETNSSSVVVRTQQDGKAKFHIV